MNHPISVDSYLTNGQWIDSCYTGYGKVLLKMRKLQFYWKWMHFSATYDQHNFDPNCLRQIEITNLWQRCDFWTKKKLALGLKVFVTLGSNFSFCWKISVFDEWLPPFFNRTRNNPFPVHVPEVNTAWFVLKRTLNLKVNIRSPMSGPIIQLGHTV